MALGLVISLRILVRQALHNPRGFQAHLDHLPDQADDIFRIVGAVGVGFDAAKFVLGHLILIDDPIERAAVPEPIFKRLLGNAGERQRWVDAQFGLVLAQPHLVFDLVRKRQVIIDDEFERIRFELFVIEMQPGQFPAGVGEGPEVRRERDARQLTLAQIPRSIEDNLVPIEPVRRRVRRLRFGMR